jgi:hypothetical protein
MGNRISAISAIALSRSTPNTSAVTLGNSGSVGVFGSTQATASGSVLVNDYNLAVSPSAATVPAGVPATYTATVTPTGNIPDSVSLSCSSGLPTGATCVLTTNPFPTLSTGAQSTTLVINTTARVTTVTHLWPRSGSNSLFYASWLPFAGLAVLGLWIGEKSQRGKRIVMGTLLGCLIALILFHAGCASTSVTTTTGTPAGTYPVTVTATSGSATRTTTVTLVVQ